MPISIDKLREASTRYRVTKSASTLTEARSLGLKRVYA
jgi:hypothetical protein